MTRSWSPGTSVWKIGLIVGAIASALTLVNLVIGATILATPNLSGVNDVQPYLDLTWGELAANLALYVLSGFLTTRAGNPIPTSALAGILTGSVGAVAAMLINMVAAVAGSQAVVTYYNNAFGEAGPGPALFSILTWFAFWGLVAAVVGVVGGSVFGLIGGAIGRLARKPVRSEA